MGTSSDARRPATVLHTSDCHLGTAPQPGVPLAAEEIAFERVVQLAHDLGVDALLIAGDLFDHARVSDDVLTWTATQLAQVACPVIIIPGNHDVLDERSVYHRFDQAARGAHVHFLDDHRGRLYEIPATDVVVWGRAMTEHEPGFRPFDGLPAPPADRWTIAAGHGLIMEEGTSGRSSPIYPDDLAAVEWDYVALGHVHAYGEVRDDPTPVRYPGSTARSRGNVPGVVVVDFVPAVGARPRWVELVDRAG